MEEYRGSVFGGFGLATDRFRVAFREISKRTGLVLVPGTLNVRLKEPVWLIPDDTVPASLGNGDEDLHYSQGRLFRRVRGEILSADVVMVRTSTQAEGRSKHDLKVIEIAGATKLREDWHLENGYVVVVSIRGLGPHVR